MSEQFPDPYEKPPFPFYQQDFDGHQPKISPEEIGYVESVFAALVDRILDNALCPSNEEMEEGSVLSSYEVQAPDNRIAGISVAREIGGRVIRRAITLYWDITRTGYTEYSAVYTNPKSDIDPAPGVVYREDNTGCKPPGIDSNEKAMLSKLKAELKGRALRFNEQPIGIEEVRALSAYLGYEG